MYTGVRGKSFRLDDGIITGPSPTAMESFGTRGHPTLFEKYIISIDSRLTAHDNMMINMDCWRSEYRADLQQQAIKLAEDETAYFRSELRGRGDWS